MGNARYDDAAYRSYSSTHRLHDVHTSRDDIFEQNRAQKIHQSLDPKGVQIRESRDSAHNPNSNAIIVGIDETGSMGMCADVMVREGANTLASQLYERTPISDPHIMFMGIGDLETDHAPLQVSQFEADIRIIEQLRHMWLEGNGGGNNYEGYALAWYFALQHTATDCWEKRQKKGYLFTMGDEKPTPIMPVNKMERVFGYRPEIHDPREILRRVQEKWNVFHLMVEEGSYYRRDGAGVVGAWRELLGDRAIGLPDHRRMAEVILSLIQINEGADNDTVVSSWGADVSDVVRYSVSSFRPGRVVDVS